MTIEQLDLINVQNVESLNLDDQILSYQSKNINGQQ